LSGTEGAAVWVNVTTVSGDEAFTFTGIGTLRRDSRGTHLRYTARNGEGETISSAVHLGMGRAMVDAGAYRLLLDPSRPTAARIGVEGGALELTATTHRVREELVGDTGTIFLHYTLAAGERPLQEMQVELVLRPMEQEP